MPTILLHYFRSHKAAFAIALIALSCGQSELAPTASGAAISAHRIELGDSVAAAQHVRFVYALSADREDRNFDMNGILGSSIERLQNWLSKQPGSRKLRIVLHDGQPETLFVRLRQTDAELIRHGVRIRDAIERELISDRLIRKDEMYLLFYDGSGPEVCGNSAWPPVLRGSVAVKYLRGRNESPSCAPPAGGTNTVGIVIFDLSALHEIFHLLGAVPRCAPHHTRDGHVSGDPRDLMYAGPLQWKPSEIDIGRDDYFDHGRRDCMDIAKSPYFE